MITTKFPTDTRNTSAHGYFPEFYATTDKRKQENETSPEDEDIENKNKLAQKKISILSLMSDSAKENPGIYSDKDQNLNNSEYSGKIYNFYDTSYIATLALQYRIGMNSNCVKINNTQTEHNASQIDAAIQKNQANFHDFINEINKQKHLGFWQRFLKIFSAVVTLAVSVATILTTGPVGIGLGLFLFLQGVNDLYDGITGKSTNFLQHGISFIARVCGASDELAEKIGMYASMAIVVLVTAATIFLSFPSALAKAVNSIGMKLFSKVTAHVSKLITSSTSIASQLLGALPKLFSTLVANIIRLAQSIIASAASIGQATLGLIAASFENKERLIHAGITETNANIDILSKYRKSLSNEISRQIESFNDGIQRILNVMERSNEGDASIVKNI